jgi:hypothetical protein
MKQTAVEFLVEMLIHSEKERFSTVELDNIINQAKGMEKEQIMEAHKWGRMELESSEQYYNQTFKSE